MATQAQIDDVIARLEMIRPDLQAATVGGQHPALYEKLDTSPRSSWPEITQEYVTKRILESVVWDGFTTEEARLVANRVFEDEDPASWAVDIHPSDGRDSRSYDQQLAEAAEAGKHRQKDKSKHRSR